MKDTIVFDRAVRWLETHCVNENAIMVNSREQIPYPEVTGYFIPTLLNWGYKDLALRFAKWLCEIQNEDGSWNSPDNSAAYVFDSAQVLKGLVAIAKYNRDVIPSIQKGCDWIISNINAEGRLMTPVQDAWGDGKTCSELVHLYCLTPLIEADELLGQNKYTDYAQKVLSYYRNTSMNEILNFGFLSHFYAYVMEALVDLGEKDIALKAMTNIEQYQRKNGMIPAYKDVNWVCSTGMFQLALVWYKLGKLEKGNKVFDYACKLQNESGGWYGSYATNVCGRMGIGKKSVPKYFTKAEISWAIKYYLDALSYKNKLEFENVAHIFSDKIEKNDGRYQIILSNISELNCDRKIKICDVGCGTGRYLRNLITENIDAELYGIDISKEVVQSITEKEIKTKIGSLTNIPYMNETFDLVYTVEALEHAVHIRNAMKELVRVTKTGGRIIIIDKNIDKLGKLKLFSYERWFDISQIKQIAQEYNCTCQILDKVSYEKFDADGLFFAAVLTKK